MLLIIGIVCIILWILGFSFHILGGFIHILLIIAIAMILYSLITGK